MTQDQHATRMNRKRPPDRDGAARPATATRVPEHRQNRQTPASMIVKWSDCLGPSLQFTGPNAPMAHRQAHRTGSGTINAHSSDGMGDGLVQHVFPLPARIQLRSPTAKASAPRRHGKNAIRYQY
jgi:hypothetical protein